MKPSILLCIGCLFSLVSFTQEFKFYLNGSTVEDSIYYDNIQKGDLMRVIFSGKSTPYRFRIATVLVTLLPRSVSGNEVINKPTGFVLDNSSDEYSNYPSFTFDLLDRLTLLKDNSDCDLTIKVQQLISDTQDGTNWVADNVKFKTITLKKRDKNVAGSR